MHLCASVVHLFLLAISQLTNVVQTVPSTLLAMGLGYFGKGCYDHSHASVSMNMCFHFSWVSSSLGVGLLVHEAGVPFLWEAVRRCQTLKLALLMGVVFYCGASITFALQLEGISSGASKHSTAISFNSHGGGDWVQGPVHTKHALHHWAAPSGNYHSWCTASFITSYESSFFLMFSFH